MTAYVPQVGGAAFYSLQEQIKGVPDWVKTERYDIDAHSSDADRGAWQNPAQQKAMLQAMLQAMLADRCRLAVHREVTETQVATLVVAKGGSKLEGDGSSRGASGWAAATIGRSLSNQRGRDELLRYLNG